VINESEFDLEKIRNYQVYSKNLDNNTGRGLLLYINKQLQSSAVKMNTTFEEVLTVEIQLRNRDSLLVALVYRSESGTPENNTELNNFLQSITKVKYSHLLLLGDFNYPSIQWQDLTTPRSAPVKESTFLEAFMASYLTHHVTTLLRRIV
jgi:hypothetical protein